MDAENGPRFGLWYDFRLPAGRPAEELYGATLDQIAWAEELGIGSVWLSEHHFTDDGVINVMREMNRVASRGVFVIDLHREQGAYRMYRIFCAVFRISKLVRDEIRWQFSEFSIGRFRAPTAKRENWYFALTMKPALAIGEVNPDFFTVLMNSSGEPGRIGGHAGKTPQ